MPISKKVTKNLREIESKKLIIIKKKIISLVLVLLTNLPNQLEEEQLPSLKQTLKVLCRKLERNWLLEEQEDS